MPIEDLSLRPSKKTLYCWRFILLLSNLLLAKPLPASRRREVREIAFIGILADARIEKEPTLAAEKNPRSFLIFSSNDSNSNFCCSFILHVDHSNVIYIRDGTEEKFLDVNWDKSLKRFPPCYFYSQSLLLKDFNPPPPLNRSGLKLVCNVNIVY